MVSGQVGKPKREEACMSGNQWIGSVRGTLSLGKHPSVSLAHGPGYYAAILPCFDKLRMPSS
jgi:hypothetical protein